MKILTGKSNLSAVALGGRENDIKNLIYFLLSNSSAGVVVVDEKRKITACNKAIIDLLGKTDLPRNIVNMPLEKFLADFPDLLKVLDKKSSVNHIPFEDSFYKVKSIKIPQGTMLMVYETTSIFQARAELQKEREKLSMKDDFLNIAAHDLRGPAGAVRGFISRILDGDAGEINPKAKGLLVDAYEGSRRLINLVNDILTMTRFGKGMIHIAPKTGILSEWVKIVMREEEIFAKERGLKLIYKLKKIPHVHADEDRIVEVLTNLVGNALKFTQKGSITISHEVKDKMVITHVADTGQGISKENQESLFKKFYDRERPTRGTGLGLGLYISKLIINQSGGKIWVSSKLEKGSTFSFSLPVAK